MSGEPGSSFDLRSVGRGTLWGLGAMLLGALIQGLVAHSSPLTEQSEAILGMVWQATGALLAGFLAARRAPGSGWLHGATSGLLLVAVLVTINGIATALPAAAALLKAAGLGAGAGALGGVAGVNTRR